MLEIGLPHKDISIKIDHLVSRVKNALKLSPFNQKVEIMAVVKYANDEDIIQIIKNGQINILGENKYQDAAKRWEKEAFKQLREKVSLHFIGHLQTNKALKVVKLFDYIDSLDSLKLATEIDKCARNLNKKMPVLIQLKTSSSPTQSGIPPENFDSFILEISNLKHISPAGIMTIAPNTTDEKVLNDAFSTAKKIYDKYFKEEKNADNYKNYFSAGMSGDFETAIKNGSTLIRVGSILFH